LTQGQQPPMQQEYIPPQLPAPAFPQLVGNPAAQQSAASQPMENESEMKISMLGPLIITMASRNADPAPYADMILDSFDDAELNKYIDAPDWWEQLTAVIPKAAPYKSWFEQLRNMVKEVLQEEALPDTVPTTPTTPPA